MAGAVAQAAAAAARLAEEARVVPKVLRRGRGPVGTVCRTDLVPDAADNCPLHIRNLFARYSTHCIARHAPRPRGHLLIYALLVDRGY